MGEQLISRREGRRRVGNIGRTTEHRLIKSDPTWPRPVTITPGRSGYVLRELDQWIEARIADRGGDESQGSCEKLEPEPAERRRVKVRQCEIEGCGNAFELPVTRGAPAEYCDEHRSTTARRAAAREGTP